MRIVILDPNGNSLGETDISGFPLHAEAEGFVNDEPICVTLSRPGIPHSLAAQSQQGETLSRAGSFRISTGCTAKLHPGCTITFEPGELTIGFQSANPLI